MGEGQNDDPAPGGTGPELRAGAPPTGTGAQDHGPPPDAQQPTRRGTRQEGPCRAASGARHTDGQGGRG